MAQTANEAMTRVAVKKGTRLYTGTGHAPYKPGRHVKLHPDHAAALIASGHVEAPAQAAPAAAPAAPAPAAPAAAATVAQAAPAAAHAAPAIGPATETAQPTPAK